MKKFEFTSEGFKALSPQLYQLKDADAAIETATLKNDFQQLMVVHFLLRPEQVIYL